MANGASGHGSPTVAPPVARGSCPGAGSVTPRLLQTAEKTVEVGRSTVEGVRTNAVRVCTITINFSTLFDKV